MFIIFVSAATYFGPAAYSKIKHEEMSRLMRGAKLTDLIESPDDKWIAFVKKSNYTVPSNCFYFFSKGDHGDEIWIINKAKMTKRLLVADHFDCDDVSRDIIDPHHLRFSPDSKTLYFETSAWVTSGAVHAVDVDGKNLRFVIDGVELRIIQTGQYKGDLVVNQHRYRFKGDTPLGSHNWDWLFTPAGKQVKLYKKEQD